MARAIHQICRKLCYEPLSEQETGILCKAVLRLSIAFLKFRQKNGFKILNILHASEKDFESIALSTVSELFERNEQNIFIRFQSYFLPYVDDLTCDENTKVYLRRIVTNRTKQGLSRIFKERDPESAKLLRNIKLTVLQSDQLQSFEDIRGWFIFLQKYKPPPIPGINIIEQEERQLFQTFKPNDTIPQMVQKTWICLDNLRLEPFSIELHDLMDLYRRYRNFFKEPATIHNQDELDNTFLLETTRSVLGGIRDQIDQMIQRYQNDEKLSPDEVGYLQNAVTQWTNDLLDGGIKSHADYFMNTDRNVSKSNYLNTYRTKFEYLTRTIRNYLKVELSDYSE